jgi:hypothetical protein
MLSTLDEVLEEFKETEEDHQDSQCQNSDSDNNKDRVNKNYSRPLLSHKEDLRCVSQLCWWVGEYSEKCIQDLSPRC